MVLRTAWQGQKARYEKSTLERMLWPSVPQSFPSRRQVDVQSDRFEQGQTRLSAIQKGSPPEWAPYAGGSSVFENKLQAAIDGVARDTVFRHHREDGRGRDVSMRDGPRSKARLTAIGGKASVRALKAPEACIAGLRDMLSFGRQEQYREGGRVGV